MKTKQIKEIETELLLEGIFQRYGYDFRCYARSSLKRRLAHNMDRSRLNHISEMIPKVLYDEDFFDRLLADLSVTVTEMFRDPLFYVAFREMIIPVLKTYPFVKIWHAGCATGEEVYSIAIVLKEEGFYERALIYATDFNNHSLDVAREGIYPLEHIRKYTENYNKSGSKASFSNYFHSGYHSARMHNFLRKNIIFSHHNLVTDGCFGEMNLIICRNVMIYFDRSLQNRVLSLLCESLCNGGFLCLGARETLDFSVVSKKFETISETERIYKKKLVDGI